jgi:hypothetical protein
LCGFDANGIAAKIKTLLQLNSDSSSNSIAIG